MEKKLLTIFGASGLVGSSILREALDRGYHVNGTLRDVDNQDRITRLKSLPSGTVSYTHLTLRTICSV